jgi:DNA repair protein RadC
MDAKIEGLRQYRIPCYRVSLVREGSVASPHQRFSNSREVFEIMRPLTRDLDREHFIVLMLDSKNKLIGMNTVSVGSISTSLVHPREVAKPAVIHNAAAVIGIHNHPSGDAAPSTEDRQCTERLVKAFKLLGIRLLDHIIIGDADYFSFADAGLLGQMEVGQ